MEASGIQTKTRYVMGGYGCVMFSAGQIRYFRATLGEGWAEVGRARMRRYMQKRATPLGSTDVTLIQCRYFGFSSVHVIRIGSGDYHTYTRTHTVRGIEESGKDFSNLSDAVDEYLERVYDFKQMQERARNGS